ncbi:hypothetical protein GLX30_30280 [Streptomyces sp. Tu 2975]|uniref:hypothetical protein n=1 Tax=Streptomyces sp. Tu 2975 TaxID=2676871 RepID=UPI00135A36E4|nr:hypothetical protein [Streptomyces sp. Tu 2975]QIP82729.1 hypothetical protein GLX30_30280 [Streptomyces sp. Tu 2975]
MSRPPTVKQLLVLADRAERGPLSAAEASRLREGIAALETSRRSKAGRIHAALDRQQQAEEEIAAVRRFMARARHRGARVVQMWALERILDGTADDEQEAA